MISWRYPKNLGKMNSKMSVEKWSKKQMDCCLDIRFWLENNISEDGYDECNTSFMRYNERLLKLEEGVEDGRSI